MAFRQYNPNPDGKRVGDCTIRAISAASTMCGGITAAMTGAIRLLSVWKISCAEQTAKIVNQSSAALT